MSNNSWTEYSKFILKELERLNNHFEMMDKQIQKLHIEIIMLKTKASVWGAMAGLIPVVIMYLFEHLNRK